jgi:hypothetical protein
MREAILGCGAAGCPKLGPRAWRGNPERLELTPPVPESGDVRERRDTERLPVVAICLHERLEEVALVLVSEPLGVEILEREEETVDRELGDPHRVEDREIRRLPFRDRMCQDLVQGRKRDGDKVDLNLLGGGVEDQLSPWPLGDYDAHLGLVRPAAKPVRVHKCSAPSVPEYDPLLGELRQGTADGCPRDRILLAELMLGRKPIRRPVTTAEDLLEK